MTQWPGPLEPAEAPSRAGPGRAGRMLLASVQAQLRLSFYRSGIGVQKEWATGLRLHSGGSQERDVCPILAPSSDSTSWPGLGGGEVPLSSPAPRAWTLGPWFLAQAPMGVDQSWVQSPPTRPSHKHVQTGLNMLSPAQGPEEWQRRGRVHGDRLYRLPHFWVLCRV